MTAPFTDINLSIKDIDLIIEALQARASRHMSMSRANPRGAKAHDLAAAAMDKLAHRLKQERDPHWDGRE
jgi:hypothetical protein